jgi:hypothetical protein
MLAKKNQPIESLILRACNEFTVLGSGQPQRLDLVGPIFKDRGAERPLVHVRPNVIAPSGSEPIKLIVRCRCVSICIPLEIRETDMNNDVNSLESR